MIKKKLNIYKRFNSIWRQISTLCNVGKDFKLGQSSLQDPQIEEGIYDCYFVKMLKWPLLKMLI